MKKPNGRSWLKEIGNLIIYLGYNTLVQSLVISITYTRKIKPTIKIIFYESVMGYRKLVLFGKTLIERTI